MVAAALAASSSCQPAQVERAGGAHGEGGAGDDEQERRVPEFGDGGGHADPGQLLRIFDCLVAVQVAPEVHR